MHNIKRSSPYQGESSVLHHFSGLQRQITTLDMQPQMERSPPDEVKPLLSHAGAYRDVLHHSLTLRFVLPSLNTVTAIGVYLPLSQRIWSSSDKEYAVATHCHQCRKPLKHGAWLTPYEQGAIWLCDDHLDQPDTRRIQDILDWWFYTPWWQSLSDKYANKTRIAPFCDTLIFIAMAHRIIQLEGFHKSDAPGATKERLRSLWRGIEGHKKPDDDLLQQMLSDALRPERWPDAQQLAQNLINVTLSKPGNWANVVNQTVANRWLDLRDGYATGILAALPWVSQRDAEKPAAASITCAGFAKPKQRGDLLLRVTSKTTLSERKFPVIRYHFTDKLGHVFRWDASLPSAPSLTVDAWYTMTGTIRDHLPQGQGIITLLYHCTRIEQASNDTLPPCFLAPEKIKQINDRAELQWQLHDINGHITGLTYVRITRSWQEGGTPLHFDITLPWPLQSCIPLLTAMESAGSARAQAALANPEQARLDPKHDKSLLRLMPQLQSPQDITAPISGYWVDDGYTEFGQSHHKDNARDGASPMERQWRKPHWFPHLADAQSHARKLMMGRITHVEIGAPTLACADFNMRGSSNYPIFIDAARRRGVHFLYEIDTQKIIPISIQGLTILSQKPEHASWPTQAHYTLKGVGFLLYPPQAFLVADSTLSTASMFQRHPAVQKLDASISVRSLTISLPERARKVWYHAPADEITLHYLRLLGARCWYVTSPGVVDTGQESTMFDKAPPTAHPALNEDSWMRWMQHEMEAERLSRAIA